MYRGTGNERAAVCGANNENDCPILRRPTAAHCPRWSLEMRHDGADEIHQSASASLLRWMQLTNYVLCRRGPELSNRPYGAPHVAVKMTHPTARRGEKMKARTWTTETRRKIGLSSTGPSLRSLASAQGPMCRICPLTQIWRPKA